VGVAVIIWAPFALRLYRERRLPHPPIWVTVVRHPDNPDAAGHVDR
jgi:undecaprenyl-diphosphatase